jgi:solute:Na+ symporter, SSS family
MLSQMKAAIHLTGADHLVIAGYFVLIMAIGLWAKKTQVTATDYFAGGRQISWWMAGISHYMSGFSAFAFVVYSEMAYVYGWVAITIFWTGVPACVLGALVFARRWRRARVITPVEFLEYRCNFKVRQLFVWTGIPAKLFDDALKIYATAVFLSVIAGLGFDVSIVLCGLIVVVYTVSGGLFALVIADYVQFLMKALAILLLLPLAIVRLGTLHQTLSGFPPGMFHPTAGPYGWLYVIGYGTVVLVSYNGNWALAQKYYSVPDERSATKAAWLSAGLTLVGTPIMFLPAILGRKFLPDLIAQRQTQNAFVLLLVTLLPVGMIGIVVTAMFSATMAAVSSDLNAIASVLTKDWYQRILRPTASENTLLGVGRGFTLLLGVIITALSIWLAHSHQQSLFQTMVSVFGVLVAPTLLPILCLLIWRSLSAAGVMTGFVSGLATGIGMTLIRQVWLAHLDLTQRTLLQWEGFGILLNMAATLLGMYAGSKLWPAEGAERERALAFAERMQSPVEGAEVGSNSRMSRTSGVVGLATSVVGVLLIAAGAISGAHAARSIDFSCGSILILLGLISAGRRRVRPHTPNPAPLMGKR